MAAAKKTTKKKATKKKVAKKKAARKKAIEAPPDLREHLPATPANLKKVLAGVKAAVEGLPKAEEPVPGDLVEVLLHFTMAEGLADGIGQECRRRFAENFVDRNEFRLTEAFELEAMLGDLAVPQLFDRCRRARESIAEIYNDQNKIDLEFLREASVSDRSLFFQRVPVIKDSVVHYLSCALSFEEILFSPRSTMRVQQRMGLDPKDKNVHAFVGELKQLLCGYGHLPIDLPGAPGKDKPIEKPELNAASWLMRLAPVPKGAKAR